MSHRSEWLSPPGPNTAAAVPLHSGRPRRPLHLCALSSTTGNLAAAPRARAGLPRRRAPCYRGAPYERRADGARRRRRGGRRARNARRARRPRRRAWQAPATMAAMRFVVARRLRAGFHDVATVFPGDRRAIAAGRRRGHTRRLPTRAALRRASLQQDPAALIVDGLFGIGLKRPARRGIRVH